jgi:hypothetical protein
LHKITPKNIWERLRMLRKTSIEMKEVIILESSGGLKTDVP